MSSRRRAAPPRLLGALLSAWRQSLPAEEWRELEAPLIAEGCREQLQLGLHRRAGQSLLQLRATDGGDAVLELITEDMPFLVDTLQLGIARAGLALRLLVHPVLHVRRDTRGRRPAARMHPRAARSCGASPGNICASRHPRARSKKPRC
jgi:glutamate dehydrogenase